MAQHYEWQRYWFDRDGPKAPSDWYLTRPDELTWLLTRERALQLSELREEPCLVLLGEPGLGKTYSARQEAQDLEAGFDNASDAVLRFDLGTDGSSLWARLVESEPWRLWLEEGRTLHLFLDSFDETLPRDGSFHRLLIDELELLGPAISRLRLRVVCRSAEWISKFGDDLRRIFEPAYPRWTGPLPRHLVLAQLRAADVALAAEVEGYSPDGFLGEIAALNLQAMAAVPLTLKMLLKVSKERGGLPETRAELFERAALHLVDEHEGERRYAEGHDLTAFQRLAVAQRIAAAALVSGRATIGTQSAAAATGALDPAEISAYSEETPGTSAASAFPVEEKHIIEVLRTALFVDAGPGRVRFRHRSLAEFLAASYLVRHELDEVQLLSLLAAPNDEEERLIPQLREMAAWVAALDPAALTELLKREPDAVLRADRLSLSPEQAALAVETLLAPDRAETIEPWDQRLVYNLRAVDYPGLADALHGPLVDPAIPEPVRMIAVTIARACQRRDLEPLLLDLALDPEASSTLRAHAMWGLVEWGSEETRRQLLPLATTAVAGDEFEQVKGAALSAVFPDCIELEATLALLTEPHQPAPRGGYVIFLRGILPGKIGVEDLPTALRWAAGVEPKLGEPDELNRLVEAILQMAFSHLHDPTIAELVAPVVYQRLEAGIRRGPLSREGEQSVFEDTTTRRILLQALVEHVPAGSLVWWDPILGLLREADYGWLLDRFEDSLGGPREPDWILLIGGFGEPREPDLERLFDLFERSENLRDKVASRFDPISLEAKGLRRRHEEKVAEEGSRAAPELDEKIQGALAKLERGDPKAWVVLDAAMRLIPPDQDKRPLLESDVNLTKLPGWERADSQTRDRIAMAALSFLERTGPDVPAEYSPGSATTLGYEALFLLAHQPIRLAGLSRRVWARWAPVVFDAPFDPLSAEEDRLAERLFKAAAAGAPAAAVDWASREVDRALEVEGDVSWALRELDDFQDPRLVDELLPKLSDETISPSASARLLEWAVHRDPKRAAALVEPYLTPEAIAPPQAATPEAAVSPEEAPADVDGRLRAEAIAAVLLRLAPAVGWPVTKRFLKEDEQLGIAVLQRAANWRNADTAGLADPELVEFATAVLDLFPPDRSASANDEREASGDDSMAAMRERLLKDLVKRGADDGVRTLEELHDRYPDAVPSSFLRAAREARRSRWNAVEPRHVVELCALGTARLVFGDRDLQEAVIASLGRIQRSLQEGELSLARQLWNSETGKPEFEMPICDWLADRLQTDLRVGGRVVNREVQVAASASGTGRAESIDIKVTAPTGNVPEEAGNATTLIEAKGAWGRKVKSDMKDQLIERYMLESGCKHGIFLVLWFPADDWTPADSRSRWDGGMSLEGARSFFARQAEKLSATGRVRVRAFVLDGTP